LGTPSPGGGQLGKRFPGARHDAQAHLARGEAVVAFVGRQHDAHRVQFVQQVARAVAQPLAAHRLLERAPQRQGQKADHGLDTVGGFWSNITVW